ncbi:MAG TPA: hypothetical protein P5098_02140 [Candidatus Dojkabacteria bacterium]|nr:hypothetical protein [Candidatus Dojkabacteria bacterium]
MNLSEVEQKFINASPEAQKKFLKRNLSFLAKRSLLGRFYKLYAQKNNPKPIKKPVSDDEPYKFMFEPLADKIGGDLDED